MKNKMEVGQLTSDKRSFDLDNLDETNSVITHITTGNQRKVRWLYKDEANRLVVLEKSEPVSQAFSRGTRLKISKVDGVAAIKHSEEKTQEKGVRGEERTDWKKGKRKEKKTKEKKKRKDAEKEGRSCIDFKEEDIGRERGE